MIIGRSSRSQSSSPLSGSIINPTTNAIVITANVSSAGINGNHALPIFFAENQFTSAPTTNSVGKIHQSVSCCSSVITIAAGASIHVMAYCAIMNKNTSPNSPQQKTPNPVPAATGTSSIRMYILNFLPYPPNKFAPGQNVLPCARSVVFGMRNFIAGRDNGSTSLRSCPAHS